MTKMQEPRLPEPTMNASKAKPESARMIGACEAAGLSFIPENGGGAGIRFRKRKG